MRTLMLLVLALAALAAPTATLARDEARVEVRGLLVAASNADRPSDPRLADYEPTLRRVLRFNSYRALGQGSTRLEPPGEARLSLGGGHHLEIESASVAGERLRVGVRWSDGGRTLMNTVLVLQRGVPAVLGGARQGDEVLAVIVVAR